MDGQTLWYVSRAAGAVTLVLFTATVVLGVLTAGRAGGAVLTRAAVLRLHRSLSMTAMVFLALHIATAIADGYVDIGLVDVIVPFAAGYDPFWVGLGTVAVDLVIAVAVTSWFRRHLPVGLWRAVHLSAYAMWPIALLHGLRVAGGDGTTAWMLALDAACLSAVAVALVLRRGRARHPDSRLRDTAALHHVRETVLRRRPPPCSPPPHRCRPPTIRSVCCPPPPSAAGPSTTPGGARCRPTRPPGCSTPPTGSRCAAAPAAASRPPASSPRSRPPVAAPVARWWWSTPARVTRRRPRTPSCCCPRRIWCWRARS